MATPDRSTPESRPFSISLPRPLWIGLATVVLVVVGVALRIGVPAYQQQAAIRHLRRLGVNIRPDVSRFGPKWFRDWMGEARLEAVGRVQHLDLSGVNLSDADLAYLIRLNGLEWLALNRNPITDEGMRHLAAIDSLRALRLEDTRVTDAGLGYLKGLKRLEVLSVKRTQVTGSGLKHLKGLAHLHFLDLEGTRIDFAALPDLKDLVGLTELRLGGTRMNHAGIVELERALPLWGRR